MRSLFYLFALLVLTLYYGLKVILAGLVFRVPNRPGGVYDEAARRWGTKQLTAAGVPVELVGWERVPDGQPVVFVSNHQSWFDILALISRIPHTVRFVYKKELGSVPILGGALKAAGHIILDRQRGDPGRDERRGVCRGDPKPNRRAAAVQEGSLRAGARVGGAHHSRVLRGDLHHHAERQRVHPPEAGALDLR
jgi:1-acyl-sn-glycerol-3-phosphate acyltransferase